MSGEGDTVQQALLSGQPIPVQRLFVTLSDAPAALYDDADLDARIELLRYRRRKSDRRQRGFVHPAHWVGASNPVDDGRRTRGGGQYDDNGNPLPDRPTEFPLLGLDDWERIGPITLASYFRQSTVDTDNGGLGPIWKITGETSDDSYITTTAQSTGLAPRYNNARLILYVAFRVTIADPDGDGTLGDRIAGPESRVVAVSPTPYPIYPTASGAAYKAPEKLVTTFASGARS